MLCAKEGELLLYYTYKCPHCHAVVSHENSLTKGSQGCPLRTCPNCGKPYIDTNCDEPALRPYKPFGLFACIMTSIVGSWFVGFGALLLIFAVGYFSGWYSVTDFHMWIAVVIGGAYGIFSFCFRVANLKKENEEKFKKWKESEKRLQDPNYANLLCRAGFPVPAKYLNNETYE